MTTVSDFLTAFLRAVDRGALNHGWWPHIARWAGEVVEAVPKNTNKPSDIFKNMQAFFLELDRINFTTGMPLTPACHAAVAELRHAIEAAGLSHQPFAYNRL